MGFFSESEHEKAKREKKEKQQHFKRELQKNGLLNMIEEKDYEKVSILQRDCMISLLAQIVIANSGMVGDTIAVATQSTYYDELSKLVKNQ